MRNDSWAELSHAFVMAITAGAKVLCCGNGGSATHASHLTAELVGRFEKGSERPSFPAINLAGDLAVVTAIANDFGFENVFKRQVEAYGKKGDILIAFSTSGNSPNIMRALEAASASDMVTILFTGSTVPDDQVDFVNYVIRSTSGQTPIIQEEHTKMIHNLCADLEVFYWAG